MANPVQADDPMVGLLLDARYRLTGLVARGGMATVYRGVDERLDRPVAVKVMHRALADDPDFVARFTREARSAARLSEPEVVAVYDQGRDAATGAAYLVMEHVDGRDLRALFRQRGALAPARAVSLMEPVLRALAAAHRAGIVHRDVKPENVLLGDDGRVKVADFGLAKAVEASGLTSTSSLLIGTVAYLAPEQIASGTADARTDVYAAGVVLWEALTGAPPYAAETAMQVAYRHVNEDVPPPSSVVEGIPPALDDLVVRATRRDPDQRPADAGVFLAELRALRPRLDDQIAAGQVGGGRRDTLVVPRPVPVPPADVPTRAAAPDRPTPARTGRRRGLVVALVVLLLALLGGGGGWYLGAGRYTRAPGVLTLAQADAEQRVRSAGLKVSEQPARFDETVPAGSVVVQRPAPNGRVRKGGTVQLVLSKGPDRRTVPGSVVGSTEAAASSAVEAAGLRVGGVTREFSAAPEGTVVRTDPAPGAPLRPDALVTLVVSKGVEQLPVPDVRGKVQADAQAALTGAGFTATLTQVFSDAVPAGTVVDQSPSGGTAGRGSAVTLSVSKGPDVTQVPDLRGLTKGQAEDRLKAQGLSGRAIDLPDGGGRVVTQSPSPGSTVRRGTTVTYYIL